MSFTLQENSAQRQLQRLEFERPSEVKKKGSVHPLDYAITLAVCWTPLQGLILYIR